MVAALAVANKPATTASYNVKRIIPVLAQAYIDKAREFFVTEQFRACQSDLTALFEPWKTYDFDLNPNLGCHARPRDLVTQGKWALTSHFNEDMAAINAELPAINDHAESYLHLNKPKTTLGPLGQKVHRDALYKDSYRHGTRFLHRMFDHLPDENLPNCRNRPEAKKAMTNLAIDLTAAGDRLVKGAEFDHRYEMRRLEKEMKKFAEQEAAADKKNSYSDGMDLHRWRVLFACAVQAERQGITEISATPVKDEPRVATLFRTILHSSAGYHFGYDPTDLRGIIRDPGDSDIYETALYNNDGVQFGSKEPKRLASINESRKAVRERLQGLFTPEEKNPYDKIIAENLAGNGKDISESFSLTARRGILRDRLNTALGTKFLPEPV